VSYSALVENRQGSILGSGWFEEGAHNHFSLLDLMTSYIKGPEYRL
jgi:hypothetical protein